MSLTANPPASVVAVLNCGSSSIKFALFDAGTQDPPRQPWWSGKVQGIGGAGARLQTQDGLDGALTLGEAEPYHDALGVIREAIRARLGAVPVRAVAHLVVHGCGGVGLSAVMIASSLGARVIAVDVSDRALQLATELGAHDVVDARAVDDVVARVRELTDGGAHASMDALGSATTAANSITCLGPRGRHVQVGLLAGADADPPLPMGRVIAAELEIYGSHGMPAHAYPAMLDDIANGRMQPQRLITDHIALDDAPAALVAMGTSSPAGITVIHPKGR